MPSIDERVVAMSFENAQFEQRIAQTLTSLGKLDTAVKNIHGASGLDDIEKSGSKVSLKAPLAALDKLRQKLGRSGDGAAQGDAGPGPLRGAGPGSQGAAPRRGILRGPVRLGPWCRRL